MVKMTRHRGIEVLWGVMGVCNQDWVASNFVDVVLFTRGVESVAVGFICTVLVAMAARQSYRCIHRTVHLISRTHSADSMDKMFFFKWKSALK